MNDKAPQTLADLDFPYRKEFESEPHSVVGDIQRLIASKVTRLA